jgi:hypothetical protein
MFEQIKITLVFKGTGPRDFSPFLSCPRTMNATITYRKKHIVTCLLGNATNNLWFLDLTLDLLSIRQAELQLIITILILQ